MRAQERERERRGARKREIPEKVRGVCKTDRKKDRQRQTDRQADRRTDRQTDILNLNPKPKT